MEREVLQEVEELKQLPRPIRSEFVYFAWRNTKLRIGVSILLLFVIFAIVGPFFAKYDPHAYIGPMGAPPSREYWMGTTTFGQDVFSQFAHGTRSTLIVGVLGGCLGTMIGILIGLFSGYRGGLVDEFLNMITNIVLIIPTLAVLIIIATYLEVRGILTQSVFIGCTAWPWAARAIRAQTFSLRVREFVDLARMSGRNSLNIILTEIAPNMMSYLLLVFILQFGGAVLNAATLDFIGLGPTRGVSLGLIMNNAVLWAALQLGQWWWLLPPGAAIAAIVGALYITNVGLDEVFNPKLREM
ncbi:MAG: ABC transporter permease [Anaerolineae bacterium]|nr:ABC transporter permease [Anaerolineae bacterium]MDW8067470.1 ABC transporter permease [Anaerolineae bacterium]